VQFDPIRALCLLSECTGDDIWSLEHCLQRGVPATWMQELGDCYESGFDHDDQTIYIGDQVVNQYQGIRDVDLAIKLGEYLGINVQELQAHSLSRRDLVRSIREQAEED
jgi:hypothetical protein